MRNLTLTSALAVSLCIACTRSGGQTPAPVWISIVISASAAPDDGVESFINRSAESFINGTCQPSALDGLQSLSVQTGHNEDFHLHLYCRQDKAAIAHYKVSMIPVSNHRVDESAKTVIGRPNVRVGPLYLGPTGEPDAILLIEKTQ